MTILFNEYKSNVGKQITWFIFLIIIVVMFMLAFPIINDPSVQPIVESNLREIPETITRVLFPGGIDSFSNMRLYFRTLLVFVSLMISIFSLNIGLDSLAREQGYGTIDYIYINPISRSEIMIQKFLANIFNILILTIFLLLATSYAYSYVGEVDFVDTIINQIRNFVVIFLQGFLFLALGTMISSFARRTSGLGGVGSIIMITLLILNTLVSAELLEIPGHEFIPLRTLQESFDYDIAKLSIALAIGNIIPSTIFLIIGNYNYNKKDLII